MLPTRLISLLRRDVPSGDVGLFVIYPNTLTQQAWNADA